MSPTQTIQILSLLANQLTSSQNPMQLMKAMFAKNPNMKKALEMAEGKSPEELQALVQNMANNSNISYEQLINVGKQFGLLK